MTADGPLVVASGTVPTGEGETRDPDWTTERATEPPQVQWRGTDAADQTGAGRWQGQASSDGDTVTVGVTQPCESRLVYGFPDADRSVTLFETSSSGA